MNLKFKFYVIFLSLIYLMSCSSPQEWMQKNLDVDHYRNGDPIPQVTDPEKWSNLKTGAWCYYNNDPKMGAIYGKLYNWYAVIDTRGLAPAGWHVPSEKEWTKFTKNLGGVIVGGNRITGDEIFGVAGGKMKETGITHWKAPNTGTTNESGFSALPGGYRNFNGIFNNVGINGAWWSSSSIGDPSFAYDRFLYYDSDCIVKTDNNKHCGFSVRCVKD